MSKDSTVLPLHEEIAQIWHGFGSRKLDDYVEWLGNFVSPNDLRLIELGAKTVQAYTDPALSPLRKEVADEAWRTGGISLYKGGTRMISDLILHGGPTASDDSDYEEIIKLDTVPCRVVYSDSLIEIVEYYPLTEEVNENPILLVSPLINGYKIFDLDNRKSYVQNLLKAGFRVLMLRHKTTTQKNKDVTYEDWVMSVVQAIRFTAKSGNKVNVVGLCMGGDLARKANAYLTALGEDIVNTETFIVSMSDYQAGTTGAVGAMINFWMKLFLQGKTMSTGIMSGDDIAAGFNKLLPRDLEVRPMYDFWYMGKDRPKNASMAWNNLTRRDVPAKAFIEYLTTCYINNSFAKGEFKVAGITLDPRYYVKARFYIAGGKDHIVPEESAFRSGRIAHPDTELVEASCGAGHVGAIAQDANSPWAKHTLNGEAVKGSWYVSNIAFLIRHSGKMVPATEYVAAA